FLARFIEHKYHDRPLQYRSVTQNEQAIADAVIQRVSVSSALFLQFGFIGDLIVVPESGEPLRYYESIPIDYIHESELGQNEHYYIVTLEYGAFGCDPLKISRDPDPDKAHMDKYLH